MKKPTRKFNFTNISDGAVTLFTTNHSGGIWQMRMRVERHKKYFQKSLRTKDKDSAIDRVAYEHAIITVLVKKAKPIKSNCSRSS